MNLSLRKASVLQNAINETIRGIDIKSEIALTEFHDPEVELARAVELARTNIARRNALTAALYEIRNAVTKANHTSGVNEKLTAAAEVEKQIQFYTGLAGKEIRESTNVLAGKLKKMSETEVKSRIYGYNDTVTTSVFAAEDIAGFKRTISELKKSKQKIQDQVLECNVRNEITISDGTVATLQAEGLI